MRAPLCVIPARGGSKRIPRKNLRPFLERPIISYSIASALDSGLFDEVMVSTDDSEIADVAARCGASVPFMRSEANSSDRATTADVLLEVLDEYEARGKKYDALCCLYPTAPFATPEKLREAALLLEGPCDSVVSAVPFSFPPQRGYVVRGGIVKWREPEYRDWRSQDLEPIYHDAGQFYFIATSTLRKCRSLLGENASLYLVPDEEAQDIDNESDWVLAEMKFRMMHRWGKVSGNQLC